MAPKRKVAGSPEAKSTTKRATKASTTSSAATTSNSKMASSKAVETIELDSSDEEAPPPKKKAAPAKKAVKKPATKAKPVLVPSVEIPTSTSTTPVPDATVKKSITKAKSVAKPVPKPKASPKKKAVVVIPPKPKDWQTLCREMFEKFAVADEEDDDDDADKPVVKADALERMEGGGIQKLFEEMDFGMEGIHPFLLAYKLKAATFGSFSREEWMNGFRAEQIGTTAGIKNAILDLEKSLYPSSTALAALPSYLRFTSKAEFKKFYVFLFNLLREEGQKSLGAEVALAIWGLVLKDYKGNSVDGAAPTAQMYDDDDDSEDEDEEMARAKLASMRDIAAANGGDSGTAEEGGKLIQEFIEYGTSLGPKFKGVSSDVWNQLLDFLDCVGPDLDGYEDDSAWPSMLDSFVEWKRAKDGTTAN